MSLLLDQKAQPEDVTMEAGGIVAQDPPQYEEGGSHPCRFRGRSRRGRCHRGANVSFSRRFTRLFIIFSTFSFLYTQRASIKISLQPLSNLISPWIAGPYKVMKNLTELPFQLHPLFGLVFYSAIAALFLTLLKMRLIQKRKEHVRRWLAESPGRDERQRRLHHHHHNHHHHHQHGRHGQTAERETIEQSPLITIQE